MSHRHSRLALCSLASLVLLAAACDGERAPTAQSFVPGGSDDIADSTDTSDTDDTDTDTDTADEETTQELTEEPACTRDVAFRAAGLSFLEPTPTALAHRLNELGFGYDAQGLTVVLAAAGDTPTIAVSATDDNQGMHDFAGTAPQPVSALLGRGGFETGAAQEQGVLRVGQVEIEIRNLTVRARTLGDCGEAWVFVDAVIPTSEGDIELNFGDDASTIEDLAGQPTSGQGQQGDHIGWSVQVMFATESIPFDFDSLQVAP